MQTMEVSRKLTELTIPMSKGTVRKRDCLDFINTAHIRYAKFIDNEL